MKDPWTAAHAAAMAGDYLEAAHALYFAVLQALASTDRVIIDSAKTVGDYTRELRRSSSHSLPAYRDFAKRYKEGPKLRCTDISDALRQVPPKRKRAAEAARPCQPAP
jgi:hypothetical protein